MRHKELTLLLVQILLMAFGTLVDFQLLIYSHRPVALLCALGACPSSKVMFIWLIEPLTLRELALEHLSIMLALQHHVCWMFFFKCRTIYIRTLEP